MSEKVPACLFREIFYRIYLNFKFIYSGSFIA